MTMLTCAIHNSHLSGVLLQTKHAACFTFLKLDLTMEVDQIRVEDVKKSVLSINS